MKLEEFDYYLNKKLIAQRPIDNRANSKLLMVDKFTLKLKDETFSNVLDYLNKGDVLVFNDSKVMNARLIGTKEDTGAKIELFLIEELNQDNWLCMGRPLKRLNIGTIINFKDNLSATVIKKENNQVQIKFAYTGEFYEIIEKIGTVPTPPYVKEKLIETEKYQTVYAKNLGSTAAPTAGLHFTKSLLTKLEKKGVELLFLTLHVGLGTFKPVTSPNIEDHKMHTESYYISEFTSERLNTAMKSDKNIIAVGTTSIRVLESVYKKHNKFVEGTGKTDIFIYPGFEFKVVDALITNFHLPKSSLLMLVSAFSSTEIIKNAYKHALKNKYRFFSFGDAMFIKRFEE